SWEPRSTTSKGFRGPVSSSEIRTSRAPAVAGRHFLPSLTSDIYHLLGRELGTGKVLRDEQALEKYSTDESGLGKFPPDCAVLCDSAEEVGLVLRLAAEHRVAVTPRGAGSGMTGGALP